MGRSPGYPGPLMLLMVMVMSWGTGRARDAPEAVFLESPQNLTTSLGKSARLRCSIRLAGEPPEVSWLRDGRPLDLADSNQVQVPMSDDDDWMVTSELSISSLQLSDSGIYQCSVSVAGDQILSRPAHLGLEGLPFFSEEPEDLVVGAATPFNLSCSAQGPPDPVQLLWLQDGVPLHSPLDVLARPPSTLSLSGLNETSSFSCEAHNAKGVTTSRTATVKVLPQRPTHLQLVSSSPTELQVSWEPGPSGIYLLTHCTVQAVPSDGSGAGGPDTPRGEPRTLSTEVPPYTLRLDGLHPLTAYHLRVACASAQGVSPWTHWVPMETPEGVPLGPPEHVTALRNGSLAVVRWQEPRRPIPGILRGYKLAYRGQDDPEVLVDVGPSRELTLKLREPLQNLTVRVAAYTGAGDGPWSAPVPLAPHEAEDGPPVRQHVQEPPAPAFSWPWWYILLGAGAATACVLFLALFLVQRRKKETRYGEVFEPSVERGELVVRYRVRKSYSRRTTEATLNSLGISEELKEKLRDVMVDRHKVALGKTLGEGEFGSVMEGQLNQDDHVLKVAVKTMKIAICTRTELEDFLSEAVCMKEFDHPNVMRLIGVCLQGSEGQEFPAPVVILPFMKHGDLHSFLLYSRLGDAPVFLPTQTLVKFMTDIASGMEYLSSKHFIHRDLAARNCMLNENMTVCVADFGLSKKIYNGDYYRQGRIAKMPVKWIAIESLADRVYTSKSDVWSFGVTMWEIATRGQTPYPGVENSEIYDYLRQGNRLKQPLDCLDGLYELMSSCWSLSPVERPTFAALREELEFTLKGLPLAQDPEEILYVNMEDGGRPGAAGAQGEPEGAQGETDCKAGCSCVTAEVHTADPAGRYVMCPAPLGDPPPAGPLRRL
ncbi:tyrosine-protein kinase receptor UFO [Tachyglossus aculeatus]|uniref:tyrosine-protein kinase receptor UFO n=1 Tax=Tachyglossus aculeatus TaxID=9261 RepID=UPI0018F53D27|nr:tyrosine-protein kinase receptor UFO [Tachyglossus aculeatus]